MSTESLDLAEVRDWLMGCYTRKGDEHVNAALARWAETYGRSLIAEVERLREALDQVRALHVSDDGDGTPCCAEDGFIWPCTTARILASLDADHTDTKEQTSE